MAIWTEHINTHTHTDISVVWYGGDIVDIIMDIISSALSSLNTNYVSSTLASIIAAQHTQTFGIYLNNSHGLTRWHSFSFFPYNIYTELHFDRSRKSRPTSFQIIYLRTHIHSAHIVYCLLFTVHTDILILFLSPSIMHMHIVVVMAPSQMHAHVVHN